MSALHANNTHDIFSVLNTSKLPKVNVWKLTFSLLDFHWIHVITCVCLTIKFSCLDSHPKPPKVGVRDLELGLLVFNTKNVNFLDLHVFGQQLFND
jgi:hypothetical protein